MSDMAKGKVNQADFVKAWGMMKAKGDDEGGEAARRLRKLSNRKPDRSGELCDVVMSSLASGRDTERKLLPCWHGDNCKWGAECTYDHSDAAAASGYATAATAAASARAALNGEPEPDAAPAVCTCWCVAMYVSLCVCVASCTVRCNDCQHTQHTAHSMRALSRTHAHAYARTRAQETTHAPHLPLISAQRMNTFF